MRIFRAMPLLVATVGALAWGLSAPASAASTDTTVQVAVSGQVGGGGADVQSSSADSRTGATTESISFSGKAVIEAKVVEDPDFRTTPMVLLSIDLSGVTGVGTLTRTKYVTADRRFIQRRLRPSDTVQFTFPFWPSGSAPTAGPVGTLALSLSFDTNTRKLTAVEGSITGQ